MIYNTADAPITFEKIVMVMININNKKMSINKTRYFKLTTHRAENKGVSKRSLFFGVQLFV